MKFTNIDKIYGVVLYAIIVVVFLYVQGCTLVGLKINDLLNYALTLTSIELTVSTIAYSYDLFSLNGQEICGARMKVMLAEPSKGSHAE